MNIKEEQTRITRILHDLTVGFSIGIAQAIVGHPLDTIKVIWQNKLTFSQVGIVRPVDLYRGFSFPFALNLCTNMTVFPLYEWSKDFLLGSGRGREDDDSERFDRVMNRVSFVSGCIAGGLSTPVVYVFDVGKIKKQVHPTFNLGRDFSMFYKTPGFMMTFWRETIGTGFYFYTYERFTNYVGRGAGAGDGGDGGDMVGMYYDIMVPFVGGSLAGLMAWTTTYCMDVIRTKQMSFDMSIRDAFYHDTSWRGLWRGYLPCACRSIIVNGVSFVIYHAFSTSLEN